MGRYIYTITYIFTSHIIFQQSLLISRAFIFREYAHTNRRKDGHDDQQQQRGDDDDDDEKKSSSHVLSIWRKIFCFQCEQRVESSSGEQKNEQSKYHNESIRSRRYHHRRRRVVRKEVLQSETPVLIDFWATWCGPCKLISKVVEKAAPEFKGNLKIVKIETDPNPILVEKYEVYGLPTLMVFKDGQPVKGSKREGAINLAKLKDYLQSHGISPA